MISRLSANHTGTDDGDDVMLMHAVWEAFPLLCILMFLIVV